MSGLLKVSEIETALENGKIIEVRSSTKRRASALVCGLVQEETVNVLCCRSDSNWLVIPLVYFTTHPDWADLAWAKLNKGHEMENAYPRCFFCGGKTKSIIIGNFDYRLEGKLYVVKDTPAGLCLQCGEKYVTGQTATRINQLIESGRITGTEEVNVISYGADNSGHSPDVI